MQALGFRKFSAETIEVRNAIKQELVLQWCTTAQPITFHMPAFADNIEVGLSAPAESFCLSHRGMFCLLLAFFNSNLRGAFHLCPSQISAAQKSTRQQCQSHATPREKVQDKRVVEKINVILWRQVRQTVSELQNHGDELVWLKLQTDFQSLMELVVGQSIFFFCT